MATSVFIDGKAGTTGLRIYERLAERSDILLITLPEEKRKEESARREALNSCDVAFLCLPDDAAREAVAMIDNPAVTVIDTSTAHRTAAGWAYGFPELSRLHREAIASSKRIADPGCHASGFIALVYPLVAAGILNKDALLTCHSLTGYSGGGKKMIAQYESGERSALYDAPRQYGLNLTHKHLPEMKALTGLNSEPVFCPIVADFYSGMEVSVPLHASMLADGCTAVDVRSALQKAYTGPVVTYSDSADSDGLLSAAALTGLDSMHVSVFASDDESRILLTARYDNLGKGASGAAVQCFNIITGKDETCGLVL